MAFLFVASPLCVNAAGCYADRGFAGFLPTVRHLPAVAFALYFDGAVYTWYTASRQFPFSYRGLAPHKFTPMTGVPVNPSGRQRGF